MQEKKRQHNNFKLEPRIQFQPTGRKSTKSPIQPIILINKWVMHPKARKHDRRNEVKAIEIKKNETN